ncbi:MAG: site-specific integrase [Burkholderiaceae bacterium]|nr:site-specific integrase [Burkholderiaceae bacterium]
MLPVIVTEGGPLLPLVRYMRSPRALSGRSSQEKLVQVVGLLLDFMAANHDCFENPVDLFAAFVERLYSGTVSPNGEDPSGLYWTAKSTVSVKQLVGVLSRFSDWLADNEGAKPLNPWREATAAEQRLAWAAWHHRKNRSFLAHTMSRDTARLEMSRARSVLLKKTPVVDHGAVKFFPEGQIENLLLEGFTVPGKRKSRLLQERLNLRDILITMLMHYGGLRMSEPFHLYVQDVITDPLDPNAALVRVYHPSEGLAPPDLKGPDGKPLKNLKRLDYLRGKHQLQPRNEYWKTEALYAGWKGGTLDDKTHFLRVYFLPTWTAGFFWQLWKLYLVQRAQLNCTHPFAFVSAKGDPYSIDAFKKAHKAAVERIGLVAAKALGTTPHGHRHAYGQRLVDCDLDAIFRKKALHHRCLESQVVYTEPDHERLMRAMSAAEERAQRKEGAALLRPLDLLAHGFEEVDPLGLLSGPKKLLRRKR